MRASALDAAKNGFNTFVVTDAIAAVNMKPGDDKKALEDMKQAGVKTVTSAEVQK